MAQDLDDDQATQGHPPLEMAWTHRDYWLPAAGYGLALMLAWGVGYALFRSKGVGGMGWFVPLVVALVLSAIFFRRLCQDVGVLTDRETYEHGKRVTVWFALISAVGMSLVERSIGTGLLNTLLGSIVFVAMLVLALFALKTKLLMDGETDRSAQERMTLAELKELRARYRRDKGLKELPKDQYDHRMGRDPQMPELPEPGRAGVYEPAYVSAPGSASGSVNAPIPAPAPSAFESEPKPKPLSDANLARTMPLRPSAPAPLTSSPAPLVSSPAPLRDAAPISDEELQAKIREVRKQALKAQRAADKTRSA
jgi:hypothetical protein